MSPGISTRGVLYTQKSAFSRRTIVRSRQFGARPLKKIRWCWSSPNLAINQHGHARRWPGHRFVPLNEPELSVYNTPWVDIPGEFQKIAQVTTGEVGKQWNLGVKMGGSWSGFGKFNGFPLAVETQNDWWTLAVSSWSRICKEFLSFFHFGVSGVLHLKSVSNWLQPVL